MTNERKSFSEKYRSSENVAEISLMRRETLLSVFTPWELSFEQIRGDDSKSTNYGYFQTFAALFDNSEVSESDFRARFNKRPPEWRSISSTGGQWESGKLGAVLAQFQKLSLLQISVLRINDF